MTPSIKKGAFGIAGKWGSLPVWMGLLTFLHLVGLLGVVAYDPTLILNLTPINLLFSTVVILGFGYPEGAWRWALIAYITYGVEVIGVQTGFPFGDYAYGWRLGPHIYDTPPMIGVLWLVTLMGTMYWAQRLVGDKEDTKSHLFRAALTATLMVAFDLIMEPVATKAGFWNWSGDHIPIKNYIAWWVIAFALAWAWRKTSHLRTNRAAGLLLIVQASFFIGLLVLPWKS